MSVDPTTLVPNGQHSLGWKFNGTNAAQGIYFVQNGGMAALDSGLSTIPTTASGSVYEVEPFADEAWFHGGILDSTAGRSNSYRRHQQIPDPNAVYKLRVRWVNGGTAPASSTNAVMQFIACQDYAELTAEITAGRGQIVAGQAIGVAVTSVPTTTVTGTVGVSGAPTVVAQDSVFWNESTTAQGASAVVTGTSRDVGAAAGAAHRYSMFNASAWADQAGSLRIEVSNDNTTWRALVADTAVAANTPVILSVPIIISHQLDLLIGWNIYQKNLLIIPQHHG